MVKNKKLKGREPSYQHYFSQQHRDPLQRKSIYKDYIPTQAKYTDLNGFTTRNHSISTKKRTAQELIQRYKACYSQKGVIQIHSGRKTARCKKICMIRNIANPLLASALLPDTFCNKNNAISAEAIKGRTTKASTQRMAPIDSKGF